MKYVIRTRRLVQTVYDETTSGSKPTVGHALAEFRKKSKKYDEEIAMRTLAIATDHTFLGITKDKTMAGTQHLHVTGKGIILLTPTGLINELGGSIGKVSPIGSWIVALLALIVSILVAIYK